MGKSELARQYLRKFQGEYATLVWLTYNTDIQEMLISDQFLLIRGLESEKQDLTTPAGQRGLLREKAELSQRALQFRHLAGGG